MYTQHSFIKVEITHIARRHKHGRSRPYAVQTKKKSGRGFDPNLSGVHLPSGPDRVIKEQSHFKGCQTDTTFGDKSLWGLTFHENLYAQSTSYATYLVTQSVTFATTLSINYRATQNELNREISMR